MLVCYLSEMLQSWGLSRIACLAWRTGGAGGESDHHTGCLACLVC